MSKRKKPAKVKPFKNQENKHKTTFEIVKGCFFDAQIEKKPKVSIFILKKSKIRVIVSI